MQYTLYTVYYYTVLYAIGIHYSIQCIEYVVYIVKVWNVDPAEIFINVNLNVNLTGNLKLYTNLCFVNNFLRAMLYKKVLIISLFK